MCETTFSLDEAPHTLLRSKSEQTNAKTQRQRRLAGAGAPGDAHAPGVRDCANTQTSGRGRLRPARGRRARARQHAIGGPGNVPEEVAAGDRGGARARLARHAARHRHGRAAHACSDARQCGKSRTHPLGWPRSCSAALANCDEIFEVPCLSTLITAPVRNSANAHRSQYVQLTCH